MTPYNPSQSPEEQQGPYPDTHETAHHRMTEEETDNLLTKAPGDMPSDTNPEAHLTEGETESTPSPAEDKPKLANSSQTNPFQEERTPLNPTPAIPTHRHITATNLPQPTIQAIQPDAETENKPNADRQADTSQTSTQNAFQNAGAVSAKTPEGGSYQFKKAKRPNRLPLVLGGSLILLIGFAICYTNNVRSTTIQQPLFGSQKNTEDEPVNLAPLLAKSKAESEKPKNVPVLPDNPANGQQTSQMAQAVPPQPDPYAEAQYQLWIQQQQQMAQDEQARQAQIQQASRAPTTVFSNNSGPAVNNSALDANNLDNPASDNDAAPQEPLQARADFFNKPPDNEHYLLSTRVAAASPFELKAGTVIPSVMISGINSDLPGQLIAQVSENVYDTATGNHLLIPQGSRLVGTYDHGIALGQRRILVAWNRIIYPDASSLDLGAMPGQDQGGYAGFHDKVDHHTWPSVRNALLLSVITAGVQLSQPRAQRGDYAYSSQQVIAGSLGMQMNQLGMMNYQQGMNMASTLKIRPGYRFNVMISKDVIIPPWQGVHRRRQTSQANTDTNSNQVISP